MITLEFENIDLRVMQQSNVISGSVKQMRGTMRLNSMEGMADFVEEDRQPYCKKQCRANREALKRLTTGLIMEKFVEKYGGKIAAGADIRDGYVAVKGWTEKSAVTLDAFCERMTEIGVETLICTDISRDGAMGGTNREMYRQLSEKFPALKITASGGVSTLEDVRSLRDMHLYGAIIGKAYYTGDIDLRKAIEVTR